jgi:hypothetical protein
MSLLKASAASTSTAEQLSLVIIDGLVMVARCSLLVAGLFVVCSSFHCHFIPSLMVKPSLHHINRITSHHRRL